MAGEVEGLWVNDTPWSNYARIVQLWDNVIGAPPLRGDTDEIQGRAGGVDVPRWVGPRVITVGTVLIGDDEDGEILPGSRPQYVANHREFARLLWNRRLPFTLRRRLILPDDSFVDHVAQTRYLDGLAGDPLAYNAAKAAISLELLDGYYYDEDPIPVALPGTVTVDADDDTHRMTVTLPGAGTLTNTTLGVAVTVSAATVLDVEEVTSSGGEGLVTAQTLDDYFFVLAPGPNVITWTGAAGASLSYRGPHL